MTAKQKKTNAAKKAAGSKKAYKAELQRQRTTFADYGCQDPRPRIEEDRRKKERRNACRGAKSFRY